MLLCQTLSRLDLRILTDYTNPTDAIVFLDNFDIGGLRFLITRLELPNSSNTEVRPFKFRPFTVDSSKSIIAI